MPKKYFAIKKKYVFLQSINNKNLNVMKQLNYLFLNCCLFLGAVFAAVPSVAQTSSIYEIQSLVPKEAIVRYWQDKQYIVYSLDGNGGAHFSLIDISILTCRDVDVGGFSVSDFEIEGEWVYFCADMGGVPYWGYFNIPTLFSSGAGIYMADLSTSCPSVEFPNRFEQIVSLMKLEVQTCSDGVHVYMIGESSLTGHTDLNHCIVDLRGNPSNPLSWQGSFAQENSAIYYYDDIAVTDNEVVVIGHKNGSNGHYITSYNQPINILSNLIPTIPYVAYYYYAGGFDDYWLDPHRPTMIEHMFGDYCAIVGYADVSINSQYINNRGPVISIYNTSSNCVYRCVVPQGFADTAKWELKDLRFNKNTKRLYLLQEMSNPVSATLNSVLCAFDVTAVGTITSAAAYYEPDMTYYSLDQARNAWEAVSVGKEKSMRLWHHMNVGDCVKKEVLPLEVLQNLDYSLGYYQYRVTLNPRVSPILGSLKYYNLEKKCE